MGIPKFFRWLSCRYPMCSQLVSENNIPEFDNFYLDMNGIIHNCTHANSEGPMPTEEEMFLAIFAYLDLLISKIKPKKLLFLAIDGVAPRAKMNQQRSRRFRSAREAEESLKKQKQTDQVNRFDKNCITPGTEFMTKLSAHLKYFIAKKVTEDSDWRNVTIIFSGQDVPGEGEHKIMDYIRIYKSTPGYLPNTRHCLYGLDSDLIMLGLLTHEPHFALLREEVTFGKQSRKRIAIERQAFYLMHLSLLREYIDKEFQPLKLSLPFPYDLENIIDDFILLSMLVGNDFIPHLPGIHINHNALGLMFDVYKRVLPHTDGYLNEGGEMNLSRMGLILKELSSFEVEKFFTDSLQSSKWLRGKKKHQNIPIQKEFPTSLSPSESNYVSLLYQFCDTGGGAIHLDLPVEMSAGEYKFVKRLCQDLRISLIRVTDPNTHIKHCQLHWTDYPKEIRDKVFQRYLELPVISLTEDEMNEEDLKKEQELFDKWKKDYYSEKLQVEDAKPVVYKYVEGLQWVLYYYYHGVCSWSWFYPYHYAPKITGNSP